MPIMIKTKKPVQKALFLTVSPYSRKAYLVQSATRPEVYHLVDLEGFENEKVVCTCEAFILGGIKMCPHIKSVMIFK